jgi:hypothetical protein
MGPQEGMHCGIIVLEIIGTIKRTRKLSLKPQQKIDLLISYVFPCSIYRVFHATVTEYIS